MMTTTNDTPRVWIGDLGAYNEGRRLVGWWIDATDRDALDAAIDRATHGGRSDYFIADSDGFGGMVGEYASAETIHALALVIGDHGLEVVQAFKDCTGEDDPDAIGEGIADRYVGEFESWADFAMSDHNVWTGRGRDGRTTTYIWTELGTLEVVGEDPSYVDWGAIGRDYNLGGCTYTGTTDGAYRLHIFRVA